MFNQIDLVPAYGRDYKGKQALLIDWHKGLDFKSPYGYVNIDQVNDLKSKGILEANFRFCKQSKKLVITL
jgi:hypothetical protein